MEWVVLLASVVVVSVSALTYNRANSVIIKNAMSNMPTLTYNRANSVIIKNAMSNMPTLTYNRANSVISWIFSVKMWMFNFSVFNFWCFPKDDCFILVLFKWLEKNKCL